MAIRTTFWRRKMNLRILFEDEHIIVCYKPSGIPTQTAKLGTADMVSLLKNHLYKKQKEKKEPYVAVIHRLDQPVEGILVFAKTPFAAKELNKGMQQGAGFGKFYKAVLCGVPAEKVGILENYLVKDSKTNTSRVALKSEKEAKKAVLEYEILQVMKIEASQMQLQKKIEVDGKTTKSEEGQKVTEIETSRSLVHIKLHTGRHHQIRVQMANIGCPIWGDTKYGVDKQSTNVDKSWKQIALCAYRLEFIHPKTRKKMEFEIEPEGEGFVTIRAAWLNSNKNLKGFRILS